MASFNSPLLCLYIFKESDIFPSFEFKINSSIILSWFLWRAANWIVLFYKITRKKYLLYFPNKSRFFSVKQSQSNHFVNFLCKAFQPLSCWPCNWDSLFYTMVWKPCITDKKSHVVWTEICRTYVQIHM